LRDGKQSRLRGLCFAEKKLADAAMLARLENGWWCLHGCLQTGAAMSSLQLPAAAYSVTDRIHPYGSEVLAYTQVKGKKRSSMRWVVVSILSHVKIEYGECARNTYRARPFEVSDDDGILTVGSNMAVGYVVFAAGDSVVPAASLIGRPIREICLANHYLGEELPIPSAEEWYRKWVRCSVL
jgi:hypothetical protein